MGSVSIMYQNVFFNILALAKSIIGLSHHELCNFMLQTDRWTDRQIQKANILGSSDLTWEHWHEY